MARIDMLRQDVEFLATLDPVEAILKDVATAAAEKNDLENTFRHFLQQRPEYMQVRLIRKDGQELIRVQRSTPEGDVTIQGDPLPNKGDRPYFKKTMQTERDGWYLSSIELNQEGGKKDKNLPVVRGAVPVFLAESEAASGVAKTQNDQPAGGAARGEPKQRTSLEGIVIINLHFRKLVTDLRDFEDRSASGLVYLTDANGRFLYHPQEDVAFSFERGLDYRLQQLYTPLNKVYRARQKSTFELNATPQLALFIKPDRDYVRDDPSMWTALNEAMANALISVGTDYASVKTSQGEEGDAIIFGVSREELMEIGKRLESELPINYDARIIGSKLAGEAQAVHYNRLSLEPGNEERALGLALVVPHHSLEAGSSNNQTVFRVTLGLLALSIAALVYFVARKAPHEAPRTATG